MQNLYAEAVKTFGGALIGLTSLLIGSAIFAGNGFYSSMLFLTGIIMIPTGLLVLATALTGGFGETPWSIIGHYRRRERYRERNRAV